MPGTLIDNPDLSQKANYHVGDTGPALTGTAAYADGTAVDWTAATGLHFRMFLTAKPGTYVVDAVATSPSPTTGSLSYQWSGSDLNSIGEYHGYFYGTLASGQRVSAPENGYIVVTVDP